MISSDIVIIALAGFFSGIIKTGVGVGSGIFLLPTLALGFPAKLALGLGAPLLLASDAIGLRYYWKQWLPRTELARLFLAALPGLILGAVLLPLIPGGIFRIGVGVFGVFYALSLLWPNFPPPFCCGGFSGDSTRVTRRRAPTSMVFWAAFPPYWPMPAAWSGPCT